MYGWMGWWTDGRANPTESYNVLEIWMGGQMDKTDGWAQDHEPRLCVMDYVEELY